VRAKNKRLKRFSENQTVPHQARKSSPLFSPSSLHSIRPQTHPLGSTRTEEKKHHHHDFVVVVVISISIIVLVRGMYLLKILLLQAGNETNRIQLSRRQKFSTSSSR